MADTCQFFKHSNITNFLQSDRFTVVFFTRQKQFSFFQSVCTRCKGNTTNCKRKKETQKFFCESIAYCFAQLHIAQHNGKKSF